MGDVFYFSFDFSSLCVLESHTLIEETFEREIVANPKIRES